MQVILSLLPARNHLKQSLGRKKEVVFLSKCKIRQYLNSSNYASGDRERQRQGFVFGVSITVGFSLACVIVFELFAPQLARLFIQDDMTVAYAAAFLRRMVLCMPFVAICHPMITQFQAMGRTRESLICSILRKGSLDIPLLLLLDRLYPLYGCALVQPVVDLISLIVALVLYRRLRRTSVV